MTPLQFKRGLAPRRASGVSGASRLGRLGASANPDRDRCARAQLSRPSVCGLPAAAALPAPVSVSPSGPPLAASESRTGPSTREFAHGGFRPSHLPQRLSGTDRSAFHPSPPPALFSTSMRGALILRTAAQPTRDINGRDATALATRLGSDQAARSPVPDRLHGRSACWLAGLAQLGWGAGGRSHPPPPFFRDVARLPV